MTEHGRLKDYNKESCVYFGHVWVPKHVKRSGKHHVTVKGYCRMKGKR